MSGHFIARDALPESVLGIQAPGLWFSRVPRFDKPRVALVGSREASPESCHYTHALAGELHARGCVVLSGGAQGVDYHAHRGALDAGGETWLVSPAGLEHVTPTLHADLFAAVRARGCLVTPFPPDHKAARWTFTRRNSVLVALADAVVVVEARAGSGSLDTAKKAIAKKSCIVLSGPPWSDQFAGNRAALELGATLACSHADVLDQLQTLLARAAGQRHARSHEARVLLRALASRPRGTAVHIDALAEVTGLALAEILPALLTLALEDVVVERLPGFWTLGA